MIPIDNTPIEQAVEENIKMIHRLLASINIHKPELDAMEAAYRKSILDRHNENR